MKRTLWTAFAVLLGLSLPGPAAFAGGYGEDYYSGAQLYVARANAPIYDCAGPGCRTDIRLRAGSWIYATCWDGGEGWCRVRTRYFKNMFLPRYALDTGYGGGYKSYGYKEQGYYPKRAHSYNDCLYRDSYKDSGGEACYEKYSNKDDCYGKSGGCYDKGYYDNSGYGYKRRLRYGSSYPKAYSYEKDYGSYSKEYSYKKDDGSYSKEYSYKKEYLPPNRKEYYPEELGYDAEQEY
jgi:hypothetical protein